MLLFHLSYRKNSSFCSTGCIFQRQKHEKKQQGVRPYKKHWLPVAAGTFQDVPFGLLFGMGSLAIALPEMSKMPESAPGDYGFDPLNMKESRQGKGKTMENHACLQRLGKEVEVLGSWK